MTIEVARAGEADRDAILEMRREAGWRSTEIEGEAWVAYGDAGPVGSLQLIDCGDGDVLLDAVVVREQHRGRGLGAAFVAAVLRERRATWWLECRAERLGFYERSGFAEVARDSLPVGVLTHIEPQSAVDRPQHFMSLERGGGSSKS